MSIESDVFQRAVIDFGKLKAYGFRKNKDGFVFCQSLMSNQFIAEIKVNDLGQVSGSVYDADSHLEYTLLRVEGDMPSYVQEVKSAYKEILTDIKTTCCHTLFFMSDQANRIASWVTKEYGDNPIFPWEKWPQFGVFKNPQNNKWYGLVLVLDESKLNRDKKGQVEIINLKINADKIPLLLAQNGFYPAYHMNKKNWITVVLDDTLPDVEVMSLIQESHAFTEKRKK